MPDFKKKLAERDVIYDPDSPEADGPIMTKRYWRKLEDARKKKIKKATPVGAIRG